MHNTPTEDIDLKWNADNVSKTLNSNNIHDRAGLTRHLRGVSRATIYRTFDENWRGVANRRVLAEISHRFKVPIALLAG